MQTLNIYSDTPFGDTAMRRLREGIGEHTLVFPEKMADSVLGQSVAGSAIESVEVAFGQPDVEAVRRAKNLRWLHVSTAGCTCRPPATRVTISLNFAMRCVRVGFR